MVDCLHEDWGYDESGEAYCHDCKQVVPIDSVPKRVPPRPAPPLLHQDAPPNTSNRRKQPRCKCGLVATFPEHDYEIKKLHNALGQVMNQRDSLQKEVEQLKKLAYPSHGFDPEDPL